MTNPFQSIINTPESPLGHQGERDERNSYAEAVAEDIRADELANISISLKEPPFGMSELSASTETDDKLKPCETKKVAGLPAMPLRQRKPLHGGVYNQNEVLELLNSHYMIGKSEQEVAVFRIKDDGSLAFMPAEQFKLDVANIIVELSVGGSTKRIPAEKFWKENPWRHERKIVFKPGGTTEPDEFNLWQGFGVVPRRTRRKIWSLLRHIWKVICRCDKAKFKYLIRWLAWLVQNPDKQPETVVLLKSRKQGTGKSTLGVIMLKIFGPQGALIDDKERLLGRFNDWLETVCFILAEEILWANDYKTADKLKSLITADTIQIERKFGACKQIPNRLHSIMTTNHEHGAALGVGDRRFFVLEISDEHACDKAWFDRIYSDQNNGGTGEFLHFLQNLKLCDWHPREILKTAEAAEQQRMSGDSVSQWSQACIDADEIIGAERATYGLDTTLDLGATHSTPLLRKSYTGFCRQNSLRPVSIEGFGTACVAMFGPRKRLSAQNNSTGNSKRRPWGYHVPEGNKWQEKVDESLGIKT